MEFCVVHFVSVITLFFYIIVYHRVLLYSVIKIKPKKYVSTFLGRSPQLSIINILHVAAHLDHYQAASS
jgi:hypothetical protein